MTNNKNIQSGFTLIEIIVTMSIVLVLAGVVVGLNYVVGQTQLLSFNSLLTVESANRVISTIGRELRTSKYSEAGAYPIALANNQELIFYSDIDYDGHSDRVRYFLNGTSLSKETIPPAGNPPIYDPQNGKTQIVAENIRNAESPLFYYFGEDFPSQQIPLSTPAQIGHVRAVQIVIRTNEQANFPDKDYILDTLIQLRMLKNEES